MQKSRKETKYTVTIKSYVLHGLTEGPYIVEYVFLISIHLLSISLDVS